MGVGGYFSRDDTDDEQLVRALREGIDAGLNLLDTAEGYGEGHSEELVGRAIQGRRSDVFVATKVSPEHLSHDAVVRSAEDSLRRLATEYIDLYQVHWPNPRTPIAETMAAMERLVRDGKIRNIGVSNFTVEETREAQAALGRGRIVAVQSEYSLFDRSVEDDLLPYCEREGLTFIAYSPLDKGELASSGTRSGEPRKIADRYGRTAAQVALNWLVSRQPVVAIPKAASREHLGENAASTDFELTAGDRNELERLFPRSYVRVPADRIRVDDKGLDEFVPSPSDLAETIRQGGSLKPVRVAPVKDRTTEYDYELVEGKLRYWAWVIAHDGKEPVPALVRRDGP